MNTGGHIGKILVMGVGNTLMRDDGAGIHVCNALRALPPPHPPLEIVDGGTIGLALLPAVEEADAVIVVDASELGAPPGTLRLFRDGEIDRQLSGKRRSVHEVALIDLFSAAAIRGRLPARRALLAIQPGSTDWGDGCTAAVRASMAEACRVVRQLACEWAGTEAAA